MIFAIFLHYELIKMISFTKKKFNLFHSVIEK